MFFKGVNVHQDQAGWGDAVTEATMRRDILLMKEAGFDLIRGSHYPHAPAFSQACDEEGMLFWSEAPFGESEVSDQMVTGTQVLIRWTRKMHKHSKQALCSSWRR